jgi:hypothetical protein
MLAPGAPVYTDRDFTWSVLPAGYEGLPYILTANADKHSTMTEALAFEIDRPATVYIAFDVRINILPAWLDDGSWTLTEDILESSDIVYLVYGKHFPAGTVVLGGNNMPPPARWDMTGRSHYRVIVLAD